MKLRHGLALTLGLLISVPVPEISQGQSSISPIEVMINTNKEYQSILDEIEVKRQELGTSYSNATSIEQKDSILNVAREYVFDKLMDDVFPEWYGTKWDMNGTTRTPGEGHIACGYFVNTVLLDVGFEIPRITWSVIPSENAIKEVAQKKNIWRSSNKPINEVKAQIEEKGEGLYVAGLDCHYGFIANDGEETWFIHADYYNASTGVKKEKADSYNPFANSRYRVMGKLLDDKMMDKWLTGKNFYTDFIIDWSRNPPYYRK